MVGNEPGTFSMASKRVTGLTMPPRLSVGFLCVVVVVVVVVAALAFAER
jgi:hypothetical protein